jgi:biopolymer transport protein ExbD
MPVHTPGSRLYSSVKFRRFKGKGGGHKSIHSELNLTPMIDMFSLLVTFLLQTFSSSGEILFMREDIRLPEAENWTDLSRAPVIGISQAIITIDGRKVADTAELLLQSQNPTPGGNPYLVPQLASALEVLKENYIATNGKEKFLGDVIVQSHKGVDFPVVWMVLYSAASVGYDNVSFAVLSTGAGAKFVSSKGGGGAAAP